MNHYQVTFYKSVDANSADQAEIVARGEIEMGNEDEVTVECRNERAKEAPSNA